jgi:hypothetical protein
MKYIKEHPSQEVDRALGLEKHQVTRLKGAIEKAYDQEWHPEGPNIDQMYAVVAPYIKTQEEAFYVATVILTDVFGAITQVNQKRN